MLSLSGRFLALALAGALGAEAASAQAPAGETPTPSPPPAATPSPPPPPPTPTPTPHASPPARIAGAPAATVLSLPAENPFGAVVEVAAALPAKPTFDEIVIPAAHFLSARVDPQGKVAGVRRERDPIPALAAETEKSLARWTFQPARRSGEPVEAWTPMRVDLAVEVDATRIERLALVPVAPETSLPTPFEWLPDAEWQESRRGGAPSDGALPVEQVETVATPKKTPWSARSHRGAFAVRLWVKVSAAGRAERMIPLEVSDPILLAYFKRATASWLFQPASVRGAPADSWNELSASGQIEYSVDIKQIAVLRRSL